MLDVRNAANRFATCPFISPGIDLILGRTVESRRCVERYRSPPFHKQSLYIPGSQSPPMTSKRIPSIQPAFRLRRLADSNRPTFRIAFHGQNRARNPKRFLSRSKLRTRTRLRPADGYDVLNYLPRHFGSCVRAPSILVAVKETRSMSWGTWSA